MLRTENAPLVLSFLEQVFVTENIRSISASELVNRLDDELYALNERLGENAFAKPAKAYLDDWAAPEAGWLRKYYARAPMSRTSTSRPPWRDRSRIDDRSGYVLGWTNERKLNALLKRASTTQDKLNALAAAEKELKDEAKQASERGQTLAALAQTTDFAEIDWQPLVNQIQALRAEKRELEQASIELQRLNTELDTIRGQIESAETEKRKVTEGIGGLDSKIEAARSALAAARRVLAEAECEAAHPYFAGIAALMQAPMLVRLEMNEPGDCDTVAVAVRDELTSRIDVLRKRQSTLGNRIVAKMGNSAGSTAWKPASSTIRWRPPPDTGSCTRAWSTTICPGSRTSSSGTLTRTRSATSPASSPS